jgi:23S rRNA (uridine2552-2'-O)-methyltransferase
MAAPRGPARGSRGLSDGKRRTPSSRRWLERQLRDPYVAEARRLGFRSRAAFKLIELAERFALLRPGDKVVDLGAAPGGWTQVAAAAVRAGEPGGGRVAAVDLTAIAPIRGVDIVQADADDESLPARLKTLLGGGAKVVLSDMAPAASGHRGADHLRIIGLAETALAVATDVLVPGGHFVCKVWQGGATPEILARLNRLFTSVRHAKPPASRPESPEVYVVALGFRGEERDQ